MKTLMDGLCDRFIDRLRAQSLQVPKGVTDQDINRFGEIHRIELPADILSFYRRVNGMGPDDMDGGNQIRFWSLEQLQSLATELPEYARLVEGADRFIVFADRLLWSIGYALWLSPGSTVSAPVFVVGVKQPLKVADGFADFLRMYVEDSPDLLA
jgi:hypothetical protein